MNLGLPPSVATQPGPPIAGGPIRVALINAPFVCTRHPSIQLGLLQGILAQHGIPARTHYFNLHFAARVGWEVYELYCRQSPRLLGDWVFARAAFGSAAPAAAGYLDTHQAELTAFTARFGRGLPYLERLREEIAPAFVQECIASVEWDAYDVVGFSSVFAQNTAALAIARQLKEQIPRLVTVFGGANFEDEMGLEYVRAIPWIDYAVLGEGDIAFPALLSRLAAGELVLNVPGVAQRSGGRALFGGRAPLVQDLDQLPDPDYDDYFTTAAAIRMPEQIFHQPIRLTYETARGCWWGAKQHCTFCGLNGLGMAFRSESPGRARAGLEALTTRYGVRELLAVDNIMDTRYIRELFGAIEDGERYSIFHEVKANLTREQLETLRRGGITAIQPGIESLNTHVLQLMRKGVTAIQNVRLLKWAHHCGMEVLWNLLTGFPGERALDYEWQLEVVRLIPHLPPPYGGAIELHRFSPNYTDAAALGIQNVRPDRGYEHIYPGSVALERIAYYFDFEAPDTLPGEFHEPNYEQVRWWRKVWGRPGAPFLTSRWEDGGLWVRDGRQVGAAAVEHRLSEQAALIFTYCSEREHSFERILAYLLEQGLSVDTAAVRQELEGLTGLGLVLAEDGHYLSLALPEREGSESAATSGEAASPIVLQGAVPQRHPCVENR